ncbi:MAG: EscU/YscU/HrcU family type III secretion system export apparatus switch protein [Treponema sp.]|nr:EscU/YscU/HrcU family type III secretion system export apparatus switch protein [Treponema sp.]
MEIKTENKNKVVAIKYKDGVEAPFITAKGTGKKADFILQIAEENNVHIQQDSNLVEFLGNQSVGDFIPEETWDVVAKIFAFIIDSKNGVNDE